jgi:hypothetical protein
MAVVFPVWHGSIGLEAYSLLCYRKADRKWGAHGVVIFAAIRIRN